MSYFDAKTFQAFIAEKLRTGYIIPTYGLEFRLFFQPQVVEKLKKEVDMRTKYKPTNEVIIEHMILAYTMNPPRMDPLDPNLFDYTENASKRYVEKMYEYALERLIYDTKTTKESYANYANNFNGPSDLQSFPTNTKIRRGGTPPPLF